MVGESEFDDWLEPLVQRFNEGKAKDEAFESRFKVKPTAGSERARYLKQKWEHLNEPDVEFYRLFAKSDMSASVSSVGFEPLFLPGSIAQFHRYVGGFGGGHKWMSFSVFTLDEVKRFRVADDVGAIEELGLSEIDAYRRFAVFGLEGRNYLMVKLGAEPVKDGLVLSLDVESRRVRVVAPGFAALMRAVVYCAAENLRMNLLSPRGRFRDWLQGSTPSSPPEWFRPKGTVFEFEELDRLPSSVSRQIFR